MENVNQGSEITSELRSPLNIESSRDIRSYLRGLGIRPVDRLDQAIEKEFGREKGERIIDEMDRLFQLTDRRVRTEGRTNRHALRDTALVEEINQNQRLSMIAAGFYDWLVLRTALERFCGFPDCFVGEVTDFGCGNGIVTNYLARRYPGSSFTGMDVSPRALAVAEEIAQETGNENVRFLQQDQLTEETDTLVSVRTMHENVTPLGTWENWKREVQDYYFAWTTHVRPGGHLVLFERMPEKKAWAEVDRVLCELGFSPRSGAQEWITCQSGDEMVKFRFAIYDKMMEKG